MSMTTPPPLAGERAGRQLPTRPERNGQELLSISANDLSGCRFLISPLLEVLAAAEALCGPYPALRGWRRRIPQFGQRHALNFPQAVVQRGIRLVTAQLLRQQVGAVSRSETDFTVLGPLAESTREFFQECLLGDWPRIRTALESDVALRAHNLASCGVRRVVESLPGLTVREARSGPAGVERGLILVPSVHVLTPVGSALITAQFTAEPNMAPQLL